MYEAYTAVSWNLCNNIKSSRHDRTDHWSTPLLEKWNYPSKCAKKNNNKKTPNKQRRKKETKNNKNDILLDSLANVHFS